MTSVRIDHETIALSDTRLLFFGGDIANTIDEWDLSMDLLGVAGTMDAPASSATLLVNGNILVLRRDVAGIYAPGAADAGSGFTALIRLRSPAVAFWRAAARPRHSFRTTSESSSPVV
ncbi:MAG: hypothetical protein H0X73_11150 [Chthoniobacterales bacterium]|nr:hypothetical protein [Chthoniobacterales bacterium]